MADEVEGMYREYIRAFNEADIDGCVDAYAFPYTDIVNVDGVPRVTQILTEEDCRSYFADHPYLRRPPERRITVEILAAEVKALAPNIAFLASEVRRLRVDGSIAGRIPADGKYRNYYFVINDGRRWRFAGYASDYPRTGAGG